MSLWLHTVSRPDEVNIGSGYKIKFDNWALIGKLQMGSL